ncbi:LPXTG cell wall anchor domain-containing protein [Plantibacter sp. RU18]|uniref:LPXTG cell wall anchor domain-containing protein n=1 Tax=Plantibacter sp. RU18 TaxID=3158143 RepID=UPI003D35A437
MNGKTLIQVLIGLIGLVLTIWSLTQLHVDVTLSVIGAIGGLLIVIGAVWTVIRDRTRARASGTTAS